MMHYNKKIDVTRVTRTPGAGGGTETTSNVLTDLACRIVQAKGNEEIKFGKVVRTVEFKMYCAITIAILQTDRVVYDSNTYEILNIKTVEHALQSFYKILLGKAS